MESDLENTIITCPLRQLWFDKDKKDSPEEYKCIYGEEELPMYFMGIHEYKNCISQKSIFPKYSTCPTYNQFLEDFKKENDIK